jgi:ribonuclease HI
MVYFRQNSVVDQAFQGSKFFDELFVYTDGAARGNPGPAGIGVVIYTRHGKRVAAFGQRIGTATNNFAEYTAMIHALRAISTFNIGRVHLRSDSELVVRQLQGTYRVKDKNLRVLFEQVTALLSRYREYDVVHIDRDQNKEADRLANEALDSAPPVTVWTEEEDLPESDQNSLF